MRLFVPLHIAILLMLPALPAHAQSVIFEDGFEDGDFTSDPEWSGDMDDFTVINKDSNHLLRLDAGSAGSSYLSTPSTNTAGYWEFYIHLDGFAPSNNNNAFIYLMSDIADLSGQVNGYAIQAGERLSEDVFRLFKITNGEIEEEILTGTTNISAGGDYRVKVSRSVSGNWMLEVGTGYMGALIEEDTGIDNEYSSASYFGIKVTYTKSNIDNFAFDFRVDIPPLTITEVSANANQVDISLNRACDPNTVQAQDFSINNGIGAPASVSVPEANTIRLTYTNPLPGGTHILTMKDIADFDGKVIAPADASFIKFDTFAPGDVIINEFMYDPPAGAAEYLELWNITDKYLDVKGWQLGDSNALNTITDATLALEPNSHIVIAADTTALFDTFGHRPYVRMSSFPALNNSGDVIQIISAEGEMADSLTYVSGWGGTDVAVERRSDSVPALYSENWADSPHPLRGTPGLPNKVEKDRTPPGLSDIRIPDSRNLVLEFDERLKVASAFDIRHYSISGDTDIASVTVLSADSVQLTLSLPLKNAVTYTLAINGPEDIFGNTASGLDTVFTYFEISPVDSGDVFITEFMYEPPPGTPEYIELYNSSNKSLDLNGWTINDNTGNIRTITTEAGIIPPGGRVVITPDNTLLKNHPAISLITMGSRFPALNNSGDDIVLKSGSGRLLDSLRYTSSWGGAEQALERRTTRVSGIWQENWGDATGGSGSPGKPNTILPDEDAPVFKKLTILSDTSLYLEFSEKINPKKAGFKPNYTLTPSQTIEAVLVERAAVTLFLAQPLQSGQEYRVRTANLQDIFGNVMSPATLEKTYIRFSKAQEGDIVINEILYTRSDGGDPEFVELYNPTDGNFNLTGWKLGDAAGAATLRADMQLQAGGYLALTGNSAFADSLGNVAYVEGFPSLNDAGDALYLQTDTGLTIDSLFYRSHWGSTDKGISLERKDPLAASNDPSNWQSHPTSARYTPGAGNASLLPDKKPPEVIFSKLISGNRIEVHFSEFITLTPGLSFTSGNLPLSVESFNPAQADKITLLFSPTKVSSVETARTLTVQNMTDIRGNLTPAAEIPIAHPLEPSSVVINEIMYNPLNDPDDNLPDQSEYVELRNTKDYAVSLEGLYLHDAPDENGGVRSVIPVTTTAKWVPAQGIALIYADEAPVFEQSNMADFFGADHLNAASTTRVDRSSLSLAASGDAVYLADSTGAVIDSVHYDESWQNPNLADTRGIALERIDPRGPGNDPSNWGSSTNEKGGTPHAENTLYQVPDQSPDQIGISFSPNPFSPDNDGYDDNLFINYRLEEADYLIKVRIYDRYGRLVRKLTDGQPAGFEGSLIWDGRKDDGTRNRIGIYIVVFEAFNSASGKNRAFKKTVVLARRL